MDAARYLHIATICGLIYLITNAVDENKLIHTTNIPFIYCALHNL